MSYTLPIFQDLIKKYPTWSTLQTYLSSPEGGNLRCMTTPGRYSVIRYTKGISDLSLPHTKWMRSVIWDTEAHRPVCVAPPKAQTQTGEQTQSSSIQEFLDGTMINVFRLAEAPEQLYIATRSQIGAGGKFYSEKTFAEMFQEALQAMRLTDQDILALLPVGSFVSFVLQHPEHRVVTRCHTPRLWIVQTGSVNQDGSVNIDEVCSSWPARFRIPSYTMDMSVTVNQFFDRLCQEKGWFFQGLTFKDGQGNRWRLRNSNYLYLRNLRGSEASAAERFLRLRSESKVTEYLKHYTEERQTFWDLEQLLRTKTQEVFAAYCDVHKARTKVLKDLDKSIQPCVFKLHSHYLEHLRPNNETVSMKHVVELVNNLPLFEQKRLLTVAPASGTPAGLVAAATALAAAANP